MELNLNELTDQTIGGQNQRNHEANSSFNLAESLEHVDYENANVSNTSDNFSMNSQPRLIAIKDTLKLRENLKNVIIEGRICTIYPTVKVYAKNKGVLEVMKLILEDKEARKIQMKIWRSDIAKIENLNLKLYQAYLFENMELRKIKPENLYYNEGSTRYELYFTGQSTAIPVSRADYPEISFTNISEINDSLINKYINLKGIVKGVFDVKHLKSKSVKKVAVIQQSGRELIELRFWDEHVFECDFVQNDAVEIYGAKVGKFNSMLNLNYSKYTEIIKTNLSP